MNRMFAKPKITSNNFKSFCIAKNIKNIIPVSPNGTITNPINKHIGAKDFRPGNLVKLFVSARGCFFPHYGHIFSSSANFFPHDIHCI